jgi:hypothetical protein
MPEWIMCRPQSIRATKPAIWRRVAVADIVAEVSFLLTQHIDKITIIKRLVEMDCESIDAAFD